MSEELTPFDICDVCPTCGAKGSCFDEQGINEADEEGNIWYVGTWAGFRCQCGQTWGVSEVGGEIEIVKGLKY